MANIAVLVPRHSMMEQVQQVIVQENLDIHLVKAIETADAVEEARAAVESGATIIVARGLQANLIKQHTNIPLVEIKLTGQELGLLMMRAKERAGRATPTIALVGFHNMFSSTEHFDLLYGIRLLVYCVDHPDDIPTMVRRAHENGAHVIIGGDAALRSAGQLGLPGLFHESTTESIREALDIALRAGYASDMEKQRNAELESIMDTSFNGIARIGIDHTISMVNLPMESMLGKPEAKLLGKMVEREIKGIQHEFVAEVLSGGREQNSTAIRVQNTLLMAVAAPIRVDGKITGAILNFHKMKNIAPHRADTPKETQLHGYVTHADFSQVLRRCAPVRRCMALAKKYALTKSPVVLYGEEGTEKDIFAESIHNNGVRKGQPFVSFDCAEAAPGEHLPILFGSAADQYLGGSAKGLLYAAGYGTLLIRNLERMEALCQHRLSTFLLRGLQQGEGAAPADVRVIATARRHLSFSVEEGRLCERLYYALGSLALELPPLRETPEDVRRLAEYYIKEYSERYSQFLVVSEGAYAALARYPWPGQLPQLRQFCESLVLTAEKRHMDEAWVEHRLADAYPKLVAQEDGYRIVVHRPPEAERIEALLKKHGGRRTHVAGELGVSTTTLWRHMKKYGLTATGPAE